MAFITIPIVYIERDPNEDDDNDIVRIKRKNKPPRMQGADLTINTNMIVSVIGEDLTNHTMVGMADGKVYECEWKRERFEDILVKVEALIDLGNISVQ